METMTLYWIIFSVFFLIVFFIDFYVTDHRRGEITVKSALIWTGIWILVALIFGTMLFFVFPQNPGSTANTAHVMGIKFMAGYLTEKSLSVDNLFVFMMTFSIMGVSAANQPRLLKLGIILAIILRIIFILVGMELVDRFHWVMYIFGVILVWTAFKMWLHDEDATADPTNNVLYKAASKMFPVDPDTHTKHLFTRHDGKLFITANLLVLLVLGSTDVLFAIDSIPAIIGVIKEGSANVLTLEEENFLAITSNVFALMGMVSLYFALQGIVDKFRFLKHGVSFILFFIGAKMLLAAIPAVEEFFMNNSWFSLVVIIATLTLSMMLSVLIKEEKTIEKTEE